MAEPRTYPVAARDALFAVLAESLREGRPLPALLELLRRTDLAAQGAYVRERLPRMRRALRSKRGRGDRAALEMGRTLFNAGLFFDCHEYLEAFWKPATGSSRLALQGLIQVGAAFHKLELDPQARAGADYLLERGAAKLQVSGLAPGLVATLARWRRSLAAGRPLRAPRLPPLKMRRPGARLPVARTPRRNRK